MKILDDKDFLYNGDKELITNLGKSNRFKNMVITDFRKIDDAKAEKQFGAITVHVSWKELYISYLGTDDSLYGWKEDFNMAFMNDLPCQIEGKKYLEDIASKYKMIGLRVGGHSKGGNVAIYASTSVSKRIQDRIIKVYNYDGPGFSNDYIKQYQNSDIIRKIETYIPQESIVGRVLKHFEKTTIVFSKERGILQHDIYSWQVKGINLIEQEKNTQTSEDINEMLETWLKNTTKEQREIFIDTIFEILNSTESTTFSGIQHTFIESLPKILNKYNEINSEDRKVLKDMVGLFIKIYFSIIKQRTPNLKLIED